MTCASVAFPEAALFDGRAFTLRDCRRGIFGGAVIGFATLTAAGVLVAFATIAAAWIVDACLSTNPYIHARASVGRQAIALDYHYPSLAGAADGSTAALLASDRDHMPASTSEAPHTPAAPAPFAPVNATALSTERFTERAHDVLFSPYPWDAAHIDTMHEIGPVAGSTAKADGTPAAAASSAPSSAGTVPTVRTSEPAKRRQTQPVEGAAVPPAVSNSQKPLPPPQTPHDANSLPTSDSHTAVYDIEAHTVYLPDGDALEAHSGLGSRLDDPRYVSEKNRGPTPPNVYDLVLRNEPFHGVRAIRLNPVGEGNMFGRDGMLAHTYMLGPSGQSFGCVSFRDYHAFLQAFLEGEVNRLVVVPHLRATASRPAPVRHGRTDRYAFNHG
jgi:Protein of unknown function (DUF2778)